MGKEVFIKGGKPERIATGTAMPKILDADRFLDTLLSYGKETNFPYPEKLHVDVLGNGKASEVAPDKAYYVMKTAENQISLGLANNRGRE